jgi:hypothetical protein
MRGVPSATGLGYACLMSRAACVVLLLTAPVSAAPKAFEPPPAYAAIFVDQATWTYAIERSDDSAEDPEPKVTEGRCRVSVRREPERAVAVVTCDRGMEPLAGTWTADRKGLWAETDGPKELVLPAPLVEKSVTWPRRRDGKVVVRFEKTADGWCRERKVGAGERDVYVTTTRTCIGTGAPPLTLAEEFVNRGPMLTRQVTFSPGTGSTPKK